MTTKTLIQNAKTTKELKTITKELKVKRYSKEGNELEKYNIRDSYISFKFMEFLQNNFNKLGVNVKYTVASTSMSLFKKLK